MASRWSKTKGNLKLEVDVDPQAFCRGSVKSLPSFDGRPVFRCAGTFAPIAGRQFSLP